jgi:hypothetical protein
VNINVDPTAESLWNISLQILDIRSSEVDAIAQIIFSMLPCVDKIYYSPLGSNHANRWCEVRNHLEHIPQSLIAGRQLQKSEFVFQTFLSGAAVNL